MAAWVWPLTSPGTSAMPAASITSSPGLESTPGPSATMLPSSTRRPTTSPSSRAPFTARLMPAPAPVARAPRATASRFAARPANSSSIVSSLLAHSVGEVLDHADRRVGEAEVAGGDALGGDRHPDQLRVCGHQADLRGRLQPRAARLPVDAAVHDLRADPVPPGVARPGAASSGRTAARCARARRRRRPGRHPGR